MKTIRILLSCYFFAFIFISKSFAQKQEFKITAHITGIADNTKLMLQNLATGKNIDSCTVKNGSFSFKGQLDEPEELRIITSNEDLKRGILHYTDLLIGNEEVTISANVSDLPLNTTTTGSATQKEAEAYNKILHAKTIALNSLKKELKSSSDPAGKTIVEDRIKEASAQLEAWKAEYIKSNFNTYFALVQYNYRKDFPTDTLARLFSSLSPELKRSKYGKAIAIELKNPKPKAGDRFYDFKAVDQNGNTTSLSRNAGKYTVLQFAGTGCYWSEQSVKNIKQIRDKLKDSVSFVTYYMDAGKETWLNSVKKNEIDWVSLWSPGGKYSVPTSKYSITGTPTFFIISPEGKLVSTWFGFEEGIIERKLR